MTQRPSYWQRFRGSIQGVNPSWQLALGMVIGMVIGLLPKESLLFFAFVFVAIVSPANLLTATLSAFFFSFVAGFEPVMSAIHLTGMTILNLEGTQSFLGELLSKPLMPWFRLENSLVIGGWAVGMALSIPIYFLALAFFDRVGLRLYDQLRRSGWCRWLIGPPTSKPSEGVT